MNFYSILAFNDGWRSDFVYIFGCWGFLCMILLIWYFVCSPHFVIIIFMIFLLPRLGLIGGYFVWGPRDTKTLYRPPCLCETYIRIEYVLIYLDSMIQTKFNRRRLWIEVDKVWERIRSMEDLTSFIRQRSNYFQCPCDLHFPRWCIPHLTFSRPGVVVGVANTCLAKSSSLVHSLAFVPFLFEQILYIICIPTYMPTSGGGIKWPMWQMLINISQKRLGGRCTLTCWTNEPLHLSL